MKSENETEGQPQVGSDDGLGLGGTVLEALVKLSKTINDCEQSLIVAERLKARGRWKAEWDGELTSTREKLASTLRERDWLEGAISRASVALSQPNTTLSHEEGGKEQL
jgi:hypothetical protein